MAKLYSYVLRCDTGFAPNPFHDYLTLATCKPRIRNTAQVGDWIIGTGSGSEAKRRAGRLVFAMCVTEVMSYEEYWKAPRFQAKKPDMEACYIKACGDNMYPKRGCPIPAFHCKPDNVKDDGKSPNVLISDDFVYYGGSADAPIVPQFCGGKECCPKWCGDAVCCATQGHKSTMFCRKTIEKVIAWIRNSGETGVCGMPLDMNEKTLREHRKRAGLAA